MPPRHAYWTILIGNAPTAFRAHDRGDLVPTFERLRQKQPDVTMKYFARGRLWESPEEARAEAMRRPPAETRGRDWRPGGAHRDPRDRFKAKPDRRRADGPRPERPAGDEPRGGWSPKRKPFAKPPAFGKAQPFGKPKPYGKAKPSGASRPFGASDRRGDRKRFGARKPSAAGKAYRDRRPAPERPVESKPAAEPPKKERVESRRRDGTTLVKKVRR